MKVTIMNNTFGKFLRQKKQEYMIHSLTNFKGGFIDRSNNSDKLCIVLAGYKEFLYPAIFSRLTKYIPRGIDVCIVSSGKQSDLLKKICENNSWSYLWTKQNNVALVQNAAISMHPKAKYIFKLDEDIFITENYFTHMLEAYEHAKAGRYTPGLLAPIIPINGYGHMRVLEKLGLMDEFDRRFEKAQYMSGSDRRIENDSEVAKFFWGEGGMVPSIDELNQRFWKYRHEERPCPIRFSIGAILFERSIWEEMGMFKVNRRTTGMGSDERELCSFCVIRSKPVMVSENIVVGHLSFGKQNETMKQYFIYNQDIFMP